MPTEYHVDPDTTDLIVDLVAGAAVDLIGTPAGVVVPASSLLKLAARLSASGVTVPDNAELSALQTEMRKRGELPEVG